VKPGDTILIPGFGEYKAFKARQNPLWPLVGTCVGEDNVYCEGSKNGRLCEELPCSAFNEHLVFFTVKQ
jgi:hypothetical protein